MIIELDQAIHERVRLSILSVIIENGGEVSFTTLKQALELSDGNLSTHVKVLTAAGILSVEKAFVSNRPRTTYTLTGEGRTRLDSYILLMKDSLNKISDGLEKLH